MKYLLVVLLPKMSRPTASPRCEPKTLVVEFYITHEANDFSPQLIWESIEGPDNLPMRLLGALESSGLVLFEVKQSSAYLLYSINCISGESVSLVPPVTQQYTVQIL